jgi:hypothetical protein
MLTKRFEPEQKWNLFRQHMASYFVFFVFFVLSPPPWALAKTDPPVPVLIKRHPHLDGNLEPNLSVEVLDRITCRLLQEYLRPDANTFLRDVAETKLQAPASQRPFGVTHLPFTKGVAKSISKGSQTAEVADDNRQVSLVWRTAWAEP